MSEQEDRRHAKRILGFALSGAAGVRQFGTSRDIAWQEPEEDIEGAAEELQEEREFAQLAEAAEMGELGLLPRLDPQRNNPSVHDEVILVVSRSRLAFLMRGEDPGEYTGAVEPGSREFRAVMGLIEEATGRAAAERRRQEGAA